VPRKRFVLQGRVSSLPPQKPLVAPSLILRIEPLAAEPFAKEIGVGSKLQSKTRDTLSPPAGANDREYRGTDRGRSHASPHNSFPKPDPRATRPGAATRDRSYRPSARLCAGSCCSMAIMHSGSHQGLPRRSSRSPRLRTRRDRDFPAERTLPPQRSPHCRPSLAHADCRGFMRTFDRFARRQTAVNMHKGQRNEVDHDRPPTLDALPAKLERNENASQARPSRAYSPS
jgi:hypothetical protein